MSLSKVQGQSPQGLESACLELADRHCDLAAKLSCPVLSLTGNVLVSFLCLTVFNYRWFLSLSLSRHRTDDSPIVCHCTFTVSLALHARRFFSPLYRTTFCLGWPLFSPSLPLSALTVATRAASPSLSSAHVRLCGTLRASHSETLLRRPKSGKHIESTLQRKTRA